MALMRSIDIPIFLQISKNILTEIVEILKDANLYFRRVLIVYGDPPLNEIADRIAESFEFSFKIHISSNGFDKVIEIEKAVEDVRPDVIIGVGGGRTLDPAKLASTRRQIGFVSIPTILSHDGISSPVAVINYGNEIKSVGVRMPLGIIVDIDVIKNSPKRGLRAGIGDLLSNISALEDWLLAEKNNKEKIDPFAFLLAKIPAENFLKTDYEGLKDERLIKELAEGLILSGIAMGIAGSSRPASGAEHLISHALDSILKEPAYHGEQVGIASIFTLFMHENDAWKTLKNFYHRLSLPQKPEDIGIEKKVFLEAVLLAPNTRKGRFTILDIKGKDKKYLEEVYRTVYHT